MTTNRVAVLLDDNGRPTEYFVAMPSLLSTQKTAHVSGNQIDVLHCPFCGSGAIVSRSDGSIQCTFCNAAFTVTVSPLYASFPQSVGGDPYPWPGRPDGGMDPSMMQMGDQPGGGFGGQLIPGGGGAAGGDEDNPFDPDGDGDDEGDEDEDGDGNPFAGDSGDSSGGGDDDEKEAEVGGSKKPPFTKKKSSVDRSQHFIGYSGNGGSAHIVHPDTVHGYNMGRSNCGREVRVATVKRGVNKTVAHQMEEAPDQICLRCQNSQKSSVLVTGGVYGRYPLYKTAYGGKVTKADYMRHLALVTAKDPNAVAAKIRAERGA